VTQPSTIESILRDLAPEVLGALVRRYGDFGLCEDAVQEALLAAALQWPRDGLPSYPKGWLIRTASRRRIELWRNDAARRRREDTVAMLEPDEEPPTTDDSLTLLLLCCHPSLSALSQVALTLRAVGGLTTAEIARAFLVPESTVAQRISRAKQRIKATGAEFKLPPETERSDRMAAVLHVLYLIFNEGYAASAGSELHRVELTSEAIRLTRLLRQTLPDDGEVAGLLALMLLTDARRPARSRKDGTLVPLADQDRTQWDAELIAEGIALITETLTRAPIGPYQLQASIAALHDEATRAEDTDWPQIRMLYDMLHSIAPGPMVTLGRIVAVAMVDGPVSGLEQLAAAEADPALAGHYRVDAVRAHLLDLTGDHDAARIHYERAARRTLSVPEQRYLESRAASRPTGVRRGSQGS
jgi:RNA polymerase sigma factor (sigma-70 family)